MVRADCFLSHQNLSKEKKKITVVQRMHGIYIKTFDNESTTFQHVSHKAITFFSPLFEHFIY